MTKPHTSKPVIGITADVKSDKYQVGKSYAMMVERAGGVPVILPCLPGCAADMVDACDAIVFTGGDDPITTRWGVPLHPKAAPVDPQRQEFELALMDIVNSENPRPVLGICLGMQLMGLHAGGTIDQHLADTLATADQHSNLRSHEVSGELGSGTVHSHHRQALTNPGALRVIATSPDGVIEAVQKDDSPFYLGVQWHPERTADNELGLGLFRKLVQAARAARTR